MTPTPETARAHIDAVLYEEGIEAGHSYTFGDLRDRFEQEYAASVENEDDFVTIKIPSGSEMNFNVTTVGLALR